MSTLILELIGLHNNVTYFDSFGVEHILKEVKACIRNKNIKQTFLEHKHTIQ